MWLIDIDVKTTLSSHRYVPFLIYQKLIILNVYEQDL